MQQSMMAYLCPGPDHHAHVNHVAMTNEDRLRHNSSLMDSIYRLHMAHIIKHLDEALAQLIVIHSYEGFTFFSDEFKKSIVIGAAQHHGRVKLRSVPGLIIIQKTVNHVLIAFKNFFGCATDKTRSKNNDRILHED